MVGWKIHKQESKLPGEISITSDMQMIPPLWQKVKRQKVKSLRYAGDTTLMAESKKPLDESERGE